RERLSIARSNAEAVQGILAAVQSRFDAGAAGPVELAAQKAAFDTAQIAISELGQQESQARASLALLLGSAPEDFDVKGTSLDPISQPAVAAGLPSELLTRRPDVAMAEANLQAASGDLVAARAAMFPSLTLTAAAGVQNPALPAIVLTIPGLGPSLSVGADLTQAIFNRGRLQARRDEAAARQLELLADYRTAILDALADVEKALDATQHLDAVRPFETGNLAENERAFEGAKLRYQAGSGDFLALLVAQRALFGARDEFVRYKLARLQASVALCKALGGGWARSHDALGSPAPSVTGWAVGAAPAENDDERR
ncbi:MAG: TolC family protein, partial [Gammaproteobacteria bacterium]|nr:TolC family protein [Gammaproteobacteria bacterium]